MCVNDASQSHLMDKHPQDQQTFQILRWRGLMKCNCSLCFSSPAALLTWSGSHNDMATGFSPKMSEARRKLYLPIFGEMALERKLAKRFMVILLEWHTAFWSNTLPLHFFLNPKVHIMGYITFTVRKNIIENYKTLIDEETILLIRKLISRSVIWGVQKQLVSGRTGTNSKEDTYCFVGRWVLMTNLIS